MKLEYLAAGSPDCPLVRLYDFDEAEASALRQVFAELATRSVLSVALNELPFIEPVNGCRLLLKVNPWDSGLMRVAEPATFECSLERRSWGNIEGLCEPFAETARGFQWLDTTDVPFLLSVDGSW